MLLSQKKCWICSINVANSAEHRIKADVAKQIGNPFYHVSFHGKNSWIKSPKSKKLKYRKSLCQDCNNSKSQPWDKSYSLFARFLKNNQQIDFLNFKIIYGVNYITELKNLHLYFAKSLGCALIESELKLPNNFSNFLKNQDNTKLNLNISIFKTISPLLLSLQKFLRLQKYENNIDFEKIPSGGIVGHGKLYVNYLNRKEKKLKSAIWWENIGCFQINYWLNIKENPIFGKCLDFFSEDYNLNSLNTDLEELEDIMLKVIKSKGKDGKKD